jgi:hypothetical protein
VLIGNHYFGNGSQYTQQLVDHGLTQDQDYTWSYYPTMRWTHDNIDQNRPSESFVKITFVDPKLATYYAVKWSK